MTLQNAGHRALGLLFPRRCAWCGKVLGFTVGECGCDKSREAIRLPDAPLDTPDLDGAPFLPAGAWACFAYEEPVRGMILRMKYEEEPALAQPLAEALAQKYDACGLAGQFDVIVPVPMTPKALKKRGYNQCAPMARKLAVHAGLPCDETTLYKARHTERQMALDRAGRLQNVRDAFGARRAEAGLATEGRQTADPDARRRVPRRGTPEAQRLQSSRAAGAGGAMAAQRVLLLDDVFTTGSTTNECAKALLAAGASACGVLCVAASLAG